MSIINDNEFKTLIYGGYIERSRQDRLFEIDSEIPMIIIRFYLDSDTSEKVSEKIYKRFKTKYILSENELEGIPVSKSQVESLVNSNFDKHPREEVLGLADVYEYINNYSFEQISNFNIYEIIKIHSILFSYAPYPEYAGRFRTSCARVLGSQVERTDYNAIHARIHEAGYEFNEIIKQKDNLEEYIRSAIRFHAKIIKIHPYSDGNGRSTRALFNLMMKYVGLPPIYVKLEEKDKYSEALEIAMLENNTKKLEKFFLFKIANAIIENDKEFSYEAIKIL